MYMEGKFQHVGSSSVGVLDSFNAHLPVHLYVVSTEKGTLDAADAKEQKLKKDFRHFCIRSPTAIRPR
jgi:GrpB-like predicted nucleotidyltransferase (UPF0157 family)